MLGLEPLGIAIFGYADADYGTGILPDLSDMDHSGAPYAALAYDGAAFHTPTFPVAGPFENAGFLLSFEMEGATITASSAAVAAANLLDLQPGTVWRSVTGTVSSSLFVDLAGPAPCNIAAFVAPNLTGSGYVRIRGYVSAADRDTDTNPVGDTNWRSPWPLGNRPFAPDLPYLVGVVRWVNEVSLRYWRIDIGDGGGVAYNEIAVLRLGRFWQPSENMDLDAGVQPGFAPADLQVASDFGGTFPQRRGNPRVLTLTWSGMAHDDAEKLAEDLHGRLGLAREVVCIYEPGDATTLHRRIVYGLLSEPGRRTAKPWFRDGKWGWDTAVAIKQLL